MSNISLDKNRADGAKNAMQMVNEAKRILTDPVQRIVYDAKMFEEAVHQPFDSCNENSFEYESESSGADIDDEELYSHENHSFNRNTEWWETKVIENFNINWIWVLSQDFCALFRIFLIIFRPGNTYLYSFL